MLALRSGSRAVVPAACKRRPHTFRRPFATQHDVQECDIVIVGGGPAGLALASALGSSQVVRVSQRVTLVEAGDLSKVLAWSSSIGSYSNRVSSLTNVSRNLLKDIGALEYVDETRTCPIEEIQVWDGVSNARIVFSASELPTGTDNLAHMTENLNLQRGLLRRISNIPDIQLLDNVRVDSIKQEDRNDHKGWPLVHLSNGQTLRTRLLVGADGYNSPVRSYAGIETYGWGYDTHAIVATLNHLSHSPPQFLKFTAYQRFLPTGPIAFLPLSHNEASLVWSMSPALAAALKHVEPIVLASMINAAFRLPEVSLSYLQDMILESGSKIDHAWIQQEIAWREKSHGIIERSAYSSSGVYTPNNGVPAEDADSVPPIVTSIQPGSVASFPLKFSHAESYIGSDHLGGARTVLLGDAAHTIHPLAGQGLNLGLGDVESLAKCIETTVLQGGDIGSRTALLPYARDRYFANHTVLSAVDKLHKLYSTTFEPVVWARSVGLEVVNELDTVKAALMMYVGSNGVQPRLSRSGYWDLAAGGVESVNNAVNITRVVGQAFAGMIGTGLKELGKSISHK